jgi:hypothetical protein
MNLITRISRMIERMLKIIPVLNAKAFNNPIGLLLFEQISTIKTYGILRTRLTV